MKTIITTMINVKYFLFYDHSHYIFWDGGANITIENYPSITNLKTDFLLFTRKN